MADTKANALSEKTQVVYEQVLQHEEGESILQALERTEQLVAETGVAEELRRAMDVETAHLRDVINSKAALQETIGTLIAGYDSLTNALGGEIDSMKEMTIRERLVGFFSSRAARSMREKRVQSADIDVQLQDLVAQTQVIGNLLADHMETLNREYTTVGSMLEKQQNALKAETNAFEAAEQQLDELNLEIGEKREALAELTGSERAQGDKELQDLINRANELTEKRNTSLSNAQTHEIFIENHKIALDRRRRSASSSTSSGSRPRTASSSMPRRSNRSRLLLSRNRLTPSTRSAPKWTRRLRRPWQPSEPRRTARSWRCSSATFPTCRSDMPPRPKSPAPTPSSPGASPRWRSSSSGTPERRPRDIDRRDLAGLLFRREPRHRHG
jgi:hypothetical protein